jgi:hypothetical protein
MKRKPRRRAAVSKKVAQKTVVLAERIERNMNGINRLQKMQCELIRDLERALQALDIESGRFRSK